MIHLTREQRVALIKKSSNAWFYSRVRSSNVPYGRGWDIEDIYLREAEFKARLAELEPEGNL